MQPREIHRSELALVMQDRMREIFEMSATEIINSGLAGCLRAGIVITGGTTLIDGSEMLAAEIFGIPVRLGNPSALHYEGLTQTIESPVYSTAMGLALHGMNNTLLPEQRVNLSNDIAEIIVDEEKKSSGILSGKSKEKVKEKTSDPDKKGLLERVTKILDNL